jgi:hypothetical protein
VKRQPFILILLLIFYFKCSNIQAQKNTTLSQKVIIESSSRKLISVDSIRMNKYARASIESQQVVDNKPSLKEIQKVKSVSHQSNSENLESDILKKLSDSYWKTQGEIKAAKTSNNLSLLEELEITSKENRLNYIEAFESIDNSTISPEQVKLYHSFKKDFTDE